MGWNRALQKNDVSSSEKLFFRTCLDCFQSTQNQYVGRLGDLKHCFPQWFGENWILAENQLFKLRKVFFSHAWTASNRTWNIVYPVTWWKERRRESKLRPSSVKPRQAAHYATGALLSRNFAPECLYLLWLQRAGCSMVYREALKKCFLHTNLMKLRQARLCKKTTFQALFFFRMPLVKSANSTSLPRLSSLQIVQMHAIHN